MAGAGVPAVEEQRGSSAPALALALAAAVGFAAPALYLARAGYWVAFWFGLVAVVFVLLAVGQAIALVARQRAGFTFRFGTSGFEHCMLPGARIGWHELRDASVEVIRHQGRSYLLVLDVDPAVPARLPRARWPHWLAWSTPRVDAAAARLHIPLSRDAGGADDLLAAVRRMARHYRAEARA
jgi:hypothetical protein